MSNYFSQFAPFCFALYKFHNSTLLLLGFEAAPYHVCMFIFMLLALSTLLEWICALSLLLLSLLLLLL